MITYFTLFSSQAYEVSGIDKENQKECFKQLIYEELARRDLSINIIRVSLALWGDWIGFRGYNGGFNGGEHVFTGEIRGYVEINKIKNTTTCEIESHTLKIEHEGFYGCVGPGGIYPYRCRRGAAL